MPIVAQRCLTCCLFSVLFFAARGFGGLATGDEPTAPSTVGGANKKTPAVTKEADENATAASESLKKNADEATAADLLAGDLGEQWSHFSSKESVSLTDVWSVVEEGDDRLLQCVGNPRGFLLTKKTFTNFQLSFEWKYLDDATGNSGVLIFTKNEPRLWPTSIQIQLHQPRTGAVFPTGDAKSDNSTEPPPNGLAKEIGQWNVCQIVSTNGRVRVTINERSLGEVTGCQPASGHIAIQSEGSKTYFRNIRILELPGTATEDAASKSDGKADATSAKKTATPEAAESTEK